MEFKGVNKHVGSWGRLKPPEGCNPDAFTFREGLEQFIAPTIDEHAKECQSRCGKQKDQIENSNKQFTFAKGASALNAWRTHGVEQDLDPAGWLAHAKGSIVKVKIKEQLTPVRAKLSEAVHKL